MFVIALIVSHGMANLFKNLYQEWSTPRSGKQPRQGGRGGQPGRGVAVVREGWMASWWHTEGRMGRKGQTAREVRWGRQGGARRGGWPGRGVTVAREGAPDGLWRGGVGRRRALAVGPGGANGQDLSRGGGRPRNALALSGPSSVGPPSAGVGR
jgi:hypothetical protein